MRDVHSFLGLTIRFSLWADKYIKPKNKYGFIEGEDFTSVFSYTVVNNGARRKIQDYSLSIDMAKSICMLTGTEKGRQCRQYFIDMEKYLEETNQTTNYLMWRQDSLIKHKNFHETLTKAEQIEFDTFIYILCNIVLDTKMFLRKNELCIYDLDNCGSMQVYEELRDDFQHIVWRLKKNSKNRRIDKKYIYKKMCDLYDVDYNITIGYKENKEYKKNTHRWFIKNRKRLTRGR